MTPDTTLPDLGRRLAGERQRKALSQAAVARRAGVAAEYLSRIERGRIHPTLRTMLKLTNALGLDLADLVGPHPARRETCPISGSRCVLDLVRSEIDIRRERAVAFTPREIRLLRKLADWIHGASPECLHAVETLFEELGRAQGSTRGPGREQMAIALANALREH